MAAIITLIAACLLLFVPLLSLMGRSSDYRWHIEAAHHVLEQPRAVPHPLFHVVTLLNEQMFALVPGIAAPRLERWSHLWTALGFYLLLALLLVHHLRRVLLRTHAPSCETHWIAAGLAFSLLLVHPILAFAPLDGLSYLGYIAVNAHHNPTIVALKPFALLSFLLACAGFPGAGSNRDDTSGSLSTIGPAALVTMASALAKPNFVLCLLPSLLLFGCWRRLARRPVRWTYLLGGFVLPILAVLAIQFFFAFGQGGNAVQFAPLMVMRLYSGFLGGKLLCSLTFPGVVYALFWKQARASISLNLAWLLLAFGLFSVYFLAESSRVRAGNFGWSAQITLFLLFVASTAFLAERSFDAHAASAQKRLWCCWSVLALHVACGIYYIGHLLLTRGQYH